MPTVTLITKHVHPNNQTFGFQISHYFGALKTKLPLSRAKIFFSLLVILHPNDE